MPKLGRNRSAMLAGLLLLILWLAWYQGGERTMRTIEQDVPVPAGAL